MAWPKDSSPPKPSSRLKAQAKSAKHITFIMNTGYTTTGASTRMASISRNAMRWTRRSSRRLRAAASDFMAFAAHFCAPNRPAGRTSNTMTMMMKMTVLEASG